MKHILFFQPTLNTNGGIDRLTSTLSMHLRDSYESTFLTVYLSEKSFVVPNEPHSLNEIETNSFFAKVAKIGNRAKDLAEFYATHHIDAVVVSADGCIASALLAKLFLHREMHVIVCMHQEIEKSAFLHRVALRLLLPQADAVVGVSRGITESLRKVVASEKLELIYNATDVIHNQQLSKEPFENSNDEQYFDSSSTTFVFVGRLVYEKALWRLLEAFTEVVKKTPTAKLLCIGEGPLRSFLEKRINELGLEENVFLLGARANVYPYILRSTALILSSFSESFGLVLVEALSLGVPIISSDCDFGPREILDTPKSNKKYPFSTAYGMLTKVPSEGLRPLPADPTIVDAIQALLAQEALYVSKDLIRRAEQFDIRHVTASWESLLEAQTNEKTVFIGMNDLLTPFVAYMAEQSRQVRIFNGHQFAFANKRIKQFHRAYSFFGIGRLLQTLVQELSLPFYFKGLQKDLAKERPSLIVVMDFIRLWFWQVLAYKKQYPNVKVFLYAETKRIPQNPLSKLLFSIFISFLVRNSTYVEKIFVYTEEGKNFLEKYISGVPIMIMPVGVDSRLFHPIPNKEYASESKVRLLMNARFVPFKNHSDLLYAIAAMETQEKEKIVLSFLGTKGSSFEQVQKLVQQLSLEECVTFLPVVPKEKVADYYWNHDVLILPSYNEAIGRVVPEAMACGLATITSDTVGANVYVEDGKTGLIFPTGDRKALSHLLQKVVTTMNLTEMGKRAAKHIQEDFTDEICSIKFLASLR